MFITELSIKRPAVSWVMSLILIIFGLFVFWKLPVRELPSGLQPPVVQVNVEYSSASSQIVDEEVTQVLEEVIGGAEGIKNIDSSSENGKSKMVDGHCVKVNMNKSDCLLSGGQWEPTTGATTGVPESQINNIIDLNKCPIQLQTYAKLKAMYLKYQREI